MADPGLSSREGEVEDPCVDADVDLPARVSAALMNMAVQQPVAMVNWTICQVALFLLVSPR